MEYTMGTAQVDPEEIAADPSRNGKRMSLLVLETERAYEQYQAEDVVRNLAYYRGKFWMGDGHGSIHTNRYKSYRSYKNETFPAVDTLKSALAQGLPQIEALDVRANSNAQIDRDNDPMVQGRRVASVLNWMAYMDDLEETVQEWVLHAILFHKAIIKTTWSPSAGRVQWRVRLPWEVHFDPSARSVREAGWAFERITLHWRDFKARLANGVYSTQDGTKPICPDSYPRSIIDRQKAGMDEAYEQQLRRSGLKEYVGIVEFWDFRRGVVHHLHVDTHQILMSAKIPYGRPYEVLVFHSGIGRIDGIPDVDLIAEIQRDINELVSARGEIVRRLVRRMLIDKRLFPDEKQFSRFTKAKTWEPALVDVPQGRRIEDHIAVTPAMDTSFDYNKHLAEDSQTIQRIIGEADYQRGVQRNIRTAAEFAGLRAGVEGRQRIRSMKVEKGVNRAFERAREVIVWAIRHPEVSGIDLDQLAYETQLDTDGEQLRNDLLTASRRFRLLPFSPIMEDRYTRRESLAMAMPMLVDPAEVSKVLNTKEFLREFFELHGLRPSILNSDEKIAELVAAEQQAMMAEQGGMPPGAMPPEMAGAMPPEAMPPEMAQTLPDGTPIPGEVPPDGWQPGGPIDAGPPPASMMNTIPFPVR